MDPLEYLRARKDAPQVTKRMCAAWTVLAYKSTKPEHVEGWREVAVAPQRDGYDAFATIHERTKSLVFVNRGAEGFKSIADWIQGAEAALFEKFSGPLKHSVEFLVTTVKSLGARNISEILATGHSWGGALAEAQVTLGNPALEDSGGKRMAIAGLGLASAGFGRAIRGLAQAREWHIDEESELDWKMNHYIRRADPILLQPRHELLGQWLPMPSVYGAVQTPAQRGYVRDWEIMPIALLNHDVRLYFESFEISAQNHLYRKRDGTMLTLPGSRPKQTEFGTQNPDDILGGAR